MQQLILRPRPPYDFSLSAAIFAGGDPDIRTFREGIFRQVLDTGTAPVLGEVRSVGTVDKPKLSLSIRSDRPVTRMDARIARGKIASLLSIDDDLTPFYRTVAGDPVLADLTIRLRGVKPPVTLSVFEALADTIIEQQISLRAAQSMERRLIRATGKELVLDGTVYYCYPDPEILAETNDATFRSCGLSNRKGEYIRNISRLIRAGDLDLERFRTYDETEAVVEELTKIRGIGRWTAEMAVLRGLHRPDSFPADDVGLRRHIAKYYFAGNKLSAEEARTFAGRWGGWSGFAAYYLVVADLLGIRPTMNEP